MSVILVWFVTAAYAYTSAAQLYAGNPNIALMFLGYTIANFGLVGALK